MRNKDNIMKDYQTLCITLGDIRIHYLAREAEVMLQMSVLNKEMNDLEKSPLVSLEDAPQSVKDLLVKG